MDNVLGGVGGLVLGIVALGLLGNTGIFGNNNNNRNYATQEYVASEFTQSAINDLGTNMNTGFMNVNSNLYNGFAGVNGNICDVKQTVLTGDMGLQNSILDTKYANQLNACQTQRDILTQTNELNTNLLTTALQNQSKMDECCCNLRASGIENTQKILDAIQGNVIDDLRSQVNDLKNTITANGIGTSIVNQVRPYPVPAYAVSSPYVGLNGFYGSNWYGNTLV